MKYIVKRNNKSTIVYRIRKYIDGKAEYFGTFQTLKEAQSYRDYLIQHNFDLGLKKENPLKYIRLVREFYEVRVSIPGNYEFYVGRWKNLEDAIYERDAFLAADRDFDAYIECTDDTIDGHIPPMKISGRVLWETKPRNDWYMMKASLGRN